MLNNDSERTLISTIIPPGCTHINGLLGIAFEDIFDMLKVIGSFVSLPFDFFIKMYKKRLTKINFWISIYITNSKSILNWC